MTYQTQTQDERITALETELSKLKKALWPLFVTVMILATREGMTML